MSAEPTERIAASLERAVAEMGAAGVQVRLERPRVGSHGDWASNVAMVLAPKLGRPPRQVAEDLLNRAGEIEGVDRAEVAGPGFLNFFLDAGASGSALPRILDMGDRYGSGDEGAGRAVMVEFVSANPTGPLHLGHGRQAALGDAIARLLEWTGWKAHREFYFNDAGGQIDRLAESVRARFQQIFGRDEPVPENGYHGEYVAEIAAAFRERHGDRYRDDRTEAALEAMRAFAVARLRQEHETGLEAFGVRFDEYYPETRLYSDGRVRETIQALDETGLTYRQDGACWLRTTRFGDQKDRVMVKSDGSPTYFLPDVAYHMSKWERGFHHVINVQGADHHSTTDRVRAGLQALGRPPEYPEYVLHQMVTVERDGQEIRFSKRAGSYTTLAGLVAEVGAEVARYFFLMRRPEAHLVFDLDLALDQSEKNPVYKVQYAHARLCQLLDQGAKGVVVGRGTQSPSAPRRLLDQGAKKGRDLSGARADPRLLTAAAERDLARQLGEFPAFVERAAANRAPQVVCAYLEQTAGLVNSWYQAGHPSRGPELSALVGNEALRNARLTLARAARTVLRNGLAVLGLQAPKRMHREVPDVVGGGVGVGQGVPAEGIVAAAVEGRARPVADGGPSAASRARSAVAGGRPSAASRAQSAAAG